MSTNIARHSLSLAFALAAWVMAETASFGAQVPDSAGSAGVRCRVEGSIVSGEIPLPGVSVVARSGEAVVAETSTDVHGRYLLQLARDASYTLSAELSGFLSLTQPIALTSGPCDSVLDWQMHLPPRKAPAQAEAPPTNAAALLSRRSVSVASRTAMAPVDQPDADIAALLPPGFSLEAAQSDAVTIAGNTDAARVDRGLLDRIQLAGPAALLLAGRGVLTRSPYQGSATYTFGGSILNTAPYQLRTDVPATEPRSAQNTFGTSLGGPLRIPRLYRDSDRRSTFQLNYSGSRADNVFDQYATVPTEAMRAGDFSSSALPLIDPRTGTPLSGNQIPNGRIDRSAAYLMSFIPLPNLPGAVQNYHASAAANSVSDNVNLRLAHNLPQGVPNAGRTESARRSAAVRITAQVQYRRNLADSLNVFPGLGGQSRNMTVGLPISVGIVRDGLVQNVSLTATHTSAANLSPFSGVENVGARAGIVYPAAASLDPMNWGVPTLLFSGVSAVRGLPPSSRTDHRVSIGYSASRPLGAHRLGFGGDYRFDTSSTFSNANARGVFTFTGLYSSAGQGVAGASGADFADFLLGAPQQATLQAGGWTNLHGHSYDAYVEDNWQATAALTINLGLRYELAQPFVETSGRMANLDATPDFSAVAPVLSGSAGPYTGAFPAALIKTDRNNLGPRLGIAYRLPSGTVLRGGYGITYTPGSYATIARQLVAQPPFAQTETIIGMPAVPLAFATALLPTTPGATTNNFGVDKNYQLGRIGTWNIAATQTLAGAWTLTAAYTGVKGSDLDILRAPNRGASGLLIPGVQAFTWESSGGRSIMHAGNLQLRRRLSHGISGNLSYSLAKSMDNASSLGGAAVVAQSDQDLESEWARSNFDRRHQFSSNLSIQLPFGRNHPHLNDGGLLATIVGDWSMALTFTAQSGTPYTARVVGAVADVLRGTNGSLRANCIGESQLPKSTVDQFFNTSAFSVPAAGTLGNCGRNTITGPGVRQLNGSFSRDLRIGGTRALTLQINALNLLNTVQWASIDTNLNSPTFGHVLAVRPMRSVNVNARFRF